MLEAIHKLHEIPNFSLTDRNNYQFFDLGERIETYLIYIKNKKLN